MTMQLSQILSPTIIVVANDLKLLKLLSMALKMELCCEVLSFVSSRSAEETVIRVRPDLLILDEQLVDCDARELAAHLHSVSDMEGVPTLFINGDASHRYEDQDDVTRVLGKSWKIEALYAVVRQLIKHSS